LTNSCLTSLPTYMMGFYLLPQGTHNQMDSVRSKFIWRGAGTVFNHMVKWQVVCRPKEFGGLGIINTRIFNECLIAKWIWKIYKQKESLWVRLITAKYMPQGDFFKSNGRVGSQFWKSLHKLKHLFKWVAIHKVGNGRITQFRNDVWLTSSPLRIGFPRLYVVCSNQDISVASCSEDNWHLTFRRTLNADAYDEWTGL
jgi:hypothetical protein